MEPVKSNLTVYDWRSDEWQLVDWYAHLIKSGDLYVTFTDDMRYMGNFLTFFRPPRTLAFSSDQKGIYFAFWLEPFLSGAFAGLWIREDCRQSPTSLRLVVESYNAAFQFATVLVGLSKQDRLIAIHEKLGYTKRMTVPGLWNGSDVTVYTLTKADWEKRHSR